MNKNDMHPIGWYASRISPYLPREAFKHAPGRLWGGLAYLAVVLAAITTIALVDLPVVVYLALSVAIGIGFGGLGFLGHEILHGTVVKSARLRDFLGAIAFAQFNLGPKLWRKWHNMEHHAKTQEMDVDPDAWASMEEMYRRPGMKWIYKLPWWIRSVANFTSFFLFFSIHSLLMFKRYIREFRPRERVVVVLQLLWPIALWATLLAVLGPVKWLFAYVLPLMMANFMVIAYISTNHQLNPLTEVNDPLANSLTVTVPGWVDVLHFNFSYHTEHHLFPGMNPKWGPQIKAEAIRQWPDRYHEMTMGQALKALWLTPRIYAANKIDLVDPNRELIWGTLGYGLNPARPAPRQVPPEEIAKPSLGRMPTMQQGD